MFERLLERMYGITLAEHDFHLTAPEISTEEFCNLAKGRFERAKVIFAEWGRIKMLTENRRFCSQITSLRGRENVDDWTQGARCNFGNSEEILPCGAIGPSHLEPKWGYM